MAGPGRQPPPAPRPPSVTLAYGERGTLDAEPTGDWGSILKAAGSPELASLVAFPVAHLGMQRGRLSNDAPNAVLGFVGAMKPRDPAELLLLTQMAAIHQATMMLARRLNHVETIPQQDAAERALNKLARTFAGQMEALKRYRSKGQQVVRVERVTVQEGGQAIVGAVSHGGRGDDEG